jgi:hypothetical protein
MTIMTISLKEDGVHPTVVDITLTTGPH